MIVHALAEEVVSLHPHQTNDSESPTLAVLLAVAFAAVAIFLGGGAAAHTATISATPEAAEEAGAAEETTVTRHPRWRRRALRPRIGPRVRRSHRGSPRTILWRPLAGIRTLCAPRRGPPLLSERHSVPVRSRPEETGMNRVSRASGLRAHVLARPTYPGRSWC